MEVHMPKDVKLSDEDLDRAIKMRDNDQLSVAQRTSLGAMLIKHHGLKPNDVASLFGVSTNTIFNDLQKLRNPDLPRPTNSWGGRRHYNMTIEDEEKYLSKWTDKALKGEILSLPQIHADLVKHLGFPIDSSTTYRMLIRHRWRKVKPDTKHPKSDPKLREDFKKNSHHYWRPP